MQNALTMLRGDHKRVKELLSELEETTERATKKREQLLGEIEMEIKVHSKIEEEIFYPAYLEAAKKKDDRALFFEATEEHHVVDTVLPELKATDCATEQFGAKAKVLKELVEHHIREEEREMFPKAKTLLGDEELEGLAETMAARKEMLLAQWKNPLTRPLKELQSVAEKLMPASLKNAKAKVIGRLEARAR